MGESSDADQIMAMALLESAHLWIRGQLDCNPPELQEGVYITTYLSSFVSLDSYKRISRHEIVPVLEILVEEKPDISVHFQQVTRDRQWFKWTYLLWEVVFGKVDPKTSQKLRATVICFDMNKFGPFEALGYHYKFSGTYALLNDSPEDRVWIKARNHNIRNTNYNPDRYFDRLMPNHAFAVSVIAMVARRFSSDLQNRSMVCPAEMMAVSMSEIDRYSPGDHLDAQKYLLIWARQLEDIQDRRSIKRNSELDKWEHYVGFGIDSGLSHLVDQVELVRNRKIVNGKLVKMTNEEMWTGFKLEGGPWIPTWQKYILACYKEQIYPTWKYDTTHELSVRNLRI